MVLLKDIRDVRVKIGYIAFQYPQLSETFISDEIAELVRQGVEVTVFTLDPPRQRDFLLEDRNVNVPVVDCSLPPSNLRRFLFLVGLFPLAVRRPISFVKSIASAVSSFRKIVCLNFLHAGKVALFLRRNKTDLLHGGFAGDPAAVAMLAAELSGVPFSFAAHAVGFFVSPILMEEKISKAKLVRAVSHYNKTYLEDHFVKISNHFNSNDCVKIKAMHCALDLNKFPLSRNSSSREFRIISVGRLVEKKGFSYLLMALRELNEEGLHFPTTIVGGGPIANELMALKARLNLGEEVDFAGPLSRLAVMVRMRMASVFVLPCIRAANGDMDGLPIAILEAMACGVPVVATNISGIPEAVKEGAGILVPPHDPAALAAAIKEVYDDWRNGGRKFTGGRRVVEEHFDLEKNVAALAWAMLGAVSR
jgi:glycosyltransferase involved in cell wall biosynthesis